MKGGRREGGREGKRREGRELKIIYICMYVYTTKYFFFLFCRELRLQHVRMTRDRKSHEKKVCTCTLYTHTLHKNIMYMYYTVYLQTCMCIYFISQVAELNEKAI